MINRQLHMILISLQQIKSLQGNICTLGYSIMMATCDMAWPPAGNLTKMRAIIDVNYNTDELIPISSVII